MTLDKLLEYLTLQRALIKS